MWFRKRDRVRETAEAIIEGLRNGTLVPDPPLDQGEGVAPPPVATPGVSAVVTVGHERVHPAVSRELFLDLSMVPEPRRPAVISELREVIRKATADAARERP